MIAQVALVIITLGFYWFYWFHSVNREMSSLLKREEPIALWTALLFVPPLGLYSFYKQGELFEDVSRATVNRWIIFLLWLTFAPAVWFIVQSKLNDLAGELSTSTAPQT